MEPTRRTLLGFVTAGVAAALAAAVALPALAVILAPLRRRAAAQGDDAWLPLGPLASFEDGVPARATFEVETRDGWTTRTDSQAAWVVRRGQAVAVFTATCPHLGCSVAWKPPAGAFACPCHESAFSLDGERLHGPARRGLDPLPSRVNGGRVEVRWMEFEPGLGERKVMGGAEADPA